MEAFSDFAIGSSADARGDLVKVFDIAGVLSDKYGSRAGQRIFTLGAEASIFAHLLRRGNPSGDLLMCCRRINTCPSFILLIYLR